MPPEPSPWDRKDFFKERKHERSESLGSASRWRDTSLHQGTREFSRWGSADFRRPSGHGKQGGWQLFPEESGHGHPHSRSTDKMMDNDGCRPSDLRGDVKFGRNSREIRGSLSQRDWNGHSWETCNGMLNTHGKLRNVNSDKRLVDDTPPPPPSPSHPHSDIVSTCDQLQSKDQHDKVGSVNGLGMGQRCDMENSLGSTDWKPLKWTRSGSLSSRGSGFSHSSSSKSMGGVDSIEVKADLQLKHVTPVHSPSGEAAACVTYAALSEEMISRKKPRLGWGEGLAKYEKKRVEVPVENVNKTSVVFSSSDTEPVNSLISNLIEKSPRVSGSSDCASPATPSSVACSSSPGLDDKSVKTTNINSDIINLCASPCPESQNHLGGFKFNLENLDINSIANLGSSLIELLQSGDPSSVDSCFVRSTMMNKLLVLKGEILKAVETTESEIDALEIELKSLIFELGGSCHYSATSSCLAGASVTPCHEKGTVTDFSLRPAPLQTHNSGIALVEKMPLCDEALNEVHDDGKDEDIDSPGTATSKFGEPLPSTKEFAPSAIGKLDEYSADFDATQTPFMKVESSVRSNGEKTCMSTCGGEEKDDMLTEGNNGVPVFSDTSLVHAGVEDKLHKSILASNEEYARKASELFVKTLPSELCKIDISGVSSVSSLPIDPRIKEKFARKRHFLRFKERVITLKFKAFQHLWKEDLRLLSARKHRTKSQKKFESSLWTVSGGYQKHRSSLHSRFSSPVAGTMSLVPTMEIINFSRKLLLDSQVKVHRNILKMPALILDKEEKVALRFISSNGLVEDPCAVEQERVMMNPWTDEEREIFLDKLATFGKNFRKIASYLPHKTTADCVQFYYKNHKSVCFEKTKKKLDIKKIGKSSTSTYLVTSGKKWNHEMNAASLDMLGGASVIAAHADSNVVNRQMYSRRLFMGCKNNLETSRGDDAFLERSSNIDNLENERENVAADVLAGICCSWSSEAMSSCVTSSVDRAEGCREWKFQKVDSVTKRPLTPDVTQNVDDETCSDESCGEMEHADWTDEEKSIFLLAVSSYGKDFARISLCVRTRSTDQCKVFFSKARKCLGLDLIPHGCGNDGSPESADGNGGGSDAEDNCVRETGSMICSDNLGSKLDQDLSPYDKKIKQEEYDPAEIMSFQNDPKNSQETNVAEHLDHRNASPVETLVADSCQTRDTPALDFDCDKCDTIQAQESVVISTNIVCREIEVDQATQRGLDMDVEAVDHNLYCPNAVVESKAAEVSSEGLAKELNRSENLNDRRDEKLNSDGQTTSLQCPMRDSDTMRNGSNLATVTSSCSGFRVNPEYHSEASVNLYSLEKSHAISLPRESSLPTPNSVAQGPATVKCKETLNHKLLSSSHDSQESRAKQCCNTGRDEFHHSLSGHLSNNVESTNILRGYPLQRPAKKEMNGDISCGVLSGVQGLPKVERNLNGCYMAQDCYLQKSNSSKPLSLVAELPLLSQNLERKSDCLNIHSRSLSDTDKPCGNGDVKLFGKILSHPSSRITLNSNAHVDEDKGNHQPKLGGIKSSNPKINGQNVVDWNSALPKVDRNNYLGLENLPVRSYGFWDGNRIQTGFPSLPDSAILLAKYPAAFGNYPMSSSKMDQHPLQTVVPSSEHNLNGVSVFPPRKVGSGSEGVMDYQVYEGRDGIRAQPFTVDMKQRQGVFTDIRRRNGFEMLSSLQQQGRGVIVGGACNGVSDPVAAIKMHYAKTDQYAQTGSIILEDESWRGKGDIGR